MTSPMPESPASPACLGVEASVLGDLFKAITERRRLKFEYRGEGRSLDPYGMAHRRGHWYIAGGTSHGERVYRVDRLERLEIGDTPDAFRRPPRFRTRDVMRTQPWESGTDETVEANVKTLALLGKTVTPALWDRSVLEEIYKDGIAL